MKKREVLIVGAEGGSLNIYEQTMEGKTFYTYTLSETHFADNDMYTESSSPLFHSFKQAIEYFQKDMHDIFFLSPVFIDSSIKDDLIDIYMDYCDGKEVGSFNDEAWDQAFGIRPSRQTIDELISTENNKGQRPYYCDVS